MSSTISHDHVTGTITAVGVELRKREGAVNPFKWITSKTDVTDGGGSYVDYTMSIGHPGGDGEPGIYLSMEGKFRQNGASPFGSEWINNWISPDGTKTRRPHQWVAYHDSGDVQHAFCGAVWFTDSEGNDTARILEDGALVLYGQGSISLLDTSISPSEDGFGNTGLTLAAGAHGGYLFGNGAGQILQLIDNSSGAGTISAYLQIYAAYFDSYQRPIELIAAGGDTDVDIAMRPKGAGVFAVYAPIEGVEQTAPAAPAADGWRIYGEDNGAGKTRLMVKFATGDAQQLAVQP